MVWFYSRYFILFWRNKSENSPRIFEHIRSDVLLRTRFVSAVLDELLHFISIDLTDSNMAHLEARKHISPDSGFPITLHPHFNPKIKDHVPPESTRQLIDPPQDRAHFADPEKKALFSAAKRIDLTESIGTVLQDIQLSQLSEQQLDELALLVNERGVVFFREQDLTTEQQVKLFEHYGKTITAFIFQT